MHANFREQEIAVHSILSILSGAIMVVLVYGLSYFPSASLGRIDEGGNTISRADQNGKNPDAEDAEAPPGDLQN